MAWNDVAGVQWSGGSIAIKLAKPREIKRKGLRDFLADFFGRPRKIEAIQVHGHGLHPDAHRAFRLLQAYWRRSRGPVGNSAGALSRPAP